MNRFVLSFLFLSNVLLAQQGLPKYSRVKVYLHETHISELAKLGLEYDHGFIAKGKYWINDVSENELAIIKSNNLQHEILIDDVSAWYVEQNKLPTDEKAIPRNDNGCQQGTTLSYNTPQNYTYGSMGGYHTYAELLAVLDNMHAKFPNLISKRQVIGEYLTQEGRPIYWLKVGVNPTIDEDKPAIFYNALHHAREPNSLSQMLFYIWYLLENYETNEEVRYIMETTEMYFVPCVNPDGYIYNEKIAPEGGGYWRKNRFVNADGDTIGVDLNRNYGFEWGKDNIGSSPVENEEVYRGPSAFSEPETQAIKAFCEQHQFKIALNYHTYSNLLIIPWGHDNSLTPDDATFRAMTKKLVAQNHYTIGTGLETVGYIVNGDSDDWMYGEQTTKPKIFSMTPEVGPQLYGFWPPRNAIDQLNKENLWQNRTAAALLKPYGDIIDLNPTNIDTSEGLLTFSLQNIGLETGEFTVNVQSKTENLQFLNESKTVTLAHLAQDSLVIAYTVLSNDKNTQDLDFEFSIDNGNIIRKMSITKKYFATPFETVLIDNIAANSANWTSNGTWATTTNDYFSADFSITDSPNGNYANKASTYIQLNDSIDLTDTEAAMVRFRGKWALEPDFDYVQFLISTDRHNYIPLCGNLTAHNNRKEPAYNGFQNTWALEEIDISAYVGQVVYFRFQLDTDDFVNEDGFYFDDFEISSIKKPQTTATETLTFLQKNNLTISPNPFSKELAIHFTLEEKTPVLYLQIVNVLGQEMAHKSIKNLSLGSHQLVWTDLNLENGIYFLKIQNTENQVITKRILKIESEGY